LPTTNQLVRKGRQNKLKRDKTKALKGSPQVRGTVLRTFTVDPKKPNSANRKCCRVRLSNGFEVTAYIPGRGSNIQEHHNILIHGGRVPDLPGVRYKVIRGTRDCSPAEPERNNVPRKQGRSRYGVKK